MMLKKIEIKTPVYENVKTGETIENKWETSDGRQFDSEGDAEHHEFYQCKVKRRGADLPTDNIELLDFESIEDMNRYEEEWIYRDHIKKYDKSKMSFPCTYVMFTQHDPEHTYSDDEEEDYYYVGPDIHVHIVTLEEYKKLMIDKISNLK